MVGLNIPLPTETIKQIPLTPTASAAVDAKDTATFNVRVMDDNDEIWATEADHRTGWNKTFKNGTYRGMLYGIVLHDYPKQVVSLTKAESVPANVREFLSWTQRYYRIDVTASTVERRRASICWYVSRWMQRVFSQRLERAFHQRAKTCGTVRKEERHPQRQDPATCSHRHTDHKGSNAQTQKTLC